ncbi:WYL domain-containing protein [Paeniglutamicibacter gangotriensis]|uniref:WYL domain-containing protein n=1 Tax=Paeniglutamicibacter gangotriensis TaxID=254787 RepID=A0A5B0EDW1_9MICC|nr:WYL domain-containing protein [Paeniglutamicibacter gangotriensis]KAA0976562.1 WYL domain-containing protein [Paeniglutamicibacter gangotriensis]
MAQFNPGTPSRAEKLVSLTYALINTPHGYSKRELRKIVDDYQGLNDAAFDRKFDRDKKDLRDMAVPVKTIGTGAEERYLITPESYRLPEVTFSTEEAAVLGLAAQLWKDTDLESFASRANGRLSAGLEDIGHGVHFTEYVPRLHAVGPAVGACLEAVWASQELSFEYLDAQGLITQRTVDAWGIGSRFGNWYLVGLDHKRQETRMFRLTRILSGLHTGKTHESRPAGFSMADTLGRLDPDIAGEAAHLRLGKDTGWALRARATSITPAETHDEVYVQFHDLMGLAAEVAKLGDGAQVLSPAPLAVMVRRKLDDALAAQKAPVPEYKLSRRRNAGRPPSTAAVARNLDIISYVARHGSPTVGQTAAHFDLSEKQLLAHLQTIMMCGVPNGLPDELIDVEWEAGTISINNAEALNAPIRLSLPEAATMLAGLASLRGLPDFEHAHAVDSAHAKLREAAVGFEGLESVLSIALRSTEENAAYATLVHAIREHLEVEMTYYSASSDAVTQRRVEPLRLLEHAGRQYLRAYSLRNEQIRSFRLDRIQSATETGVSFALDPARHEDTDEIFFTPGPADQLVVLGFSPRLASLVDEYAPEGWAKAGDEIIAEIRMSSTRTIPGMVAYHGGDLRAIGPVSLCTEVEAWLSAATTGSEVK